MTTKLDKLLKKIDPFHRIGEIHKRMYSAQKTFSYGSLKIRNWHEYQNYLARYFCHIENVSLKVKMPVHPEMHYHRCIRFLKEEFGPNREKIAYEMAKIGVNGGLYAVLNILAKRLAEFYTRNTIISYVDEYWNKLSYNARMAAAEEYRKKYRSLFPATYKDVSTKLLAAHLPRILEEHMYLLKRFREIGS